MSNFYMSVLVEKECGHDEAMKGLALSYNTPCAKASDAAHKLCNLDNGHNKFLESMYMWLRVRAPRYWWQEADTYRVGCSKQSQSTMHTFKKDILTCEYPGEAYFEEGSICAEQWDMLVTACKMNAPKWVIKSRIPEGFLQERMWCLNYKCLRNIILQRKNHELPHWKLFIDTVVGQLKHSELLGLGIS